MSHETPLPATASGSNSSEGSPPFAGIAHPGQRPELAIDTNLQRDGSGSSENGGQLPRNKSSVDRLRLEATAGASSSRAPSPSDKAFSEAGSASRPASPHPSNAGSRYSYSTPRSSVGYPRAYSTHSISSLRQPLGPPTSGAPHKRAMQLEMPRRLGAQPDEHGDFFHGMPRHHESMYFTHDGQMRPPTRPNTDTDFGPPSPRRQRVPSGLSLTTNANDAAN